MFDNLELTVIRVEGLGNVSNSVCSVSLNEETIEVIPLKDSESFQKICTVNSKGELRLCIEDQTILASVRFNVSIIKCQGYHWLPLFLESSDSIKEVPEEVGLPRILLIFQSHKFLSPVIEITETSEPSENIEPLDFNEFPSEEMKKNLELRMKIIELEQALQFEKNNQINESENITRDFKAILDKMNFDLEKYKIWAEKYKNKSKDLTEEIEKKNQQLQENIEEKELIQAELNLYKNKFTELLTNQESIYLMLEAKDQEINSLKLSQQKSLNLDTHTCDVISIHAFPKPSKTKTKPNLINFPTSNTENNLTDAQILSDQTTYYLNENLSRLKLEGLFIKTQEQYYKVGNKKVGVILKNGTVYCKLGEIYKTLENYIYSYCSQELETFIKKRANKKPTHKRFSTFSSSFDHTLNQINKSFRVEAESHKQLRPTNKSITPHLVRPNKN